MLERRRTSSAAGRHQPERVVLPFQLGTTCSLALDPNGVKEAFFIGPGTGWNSVTISLTGSTTEASWVLIDTASGSYEAQMR